MSLGVGGLTIPASSRELYFYLLYALCFYLKISFKKGFCGKTKSCEKPT